jgi:hypothetical protein
LLFASSTGGFTEGLLFAPSSFRGGLLSERRMVVRSAAKRRKNREQKTNRLSLEVWESAGMYCYRLSIQRARGYR